MSLTRNRRRAPAAATAQETSVQPFAPAVNRPVARPAIRPSQPAPAPATQPVIRSAVRPSRAALLHSPVQPAADTPRAMSRERSIGEKGNTIVVAKKPPTGRNLPHWKQAERWFWLTHPETLERELVKPAGTTHVQGPFEMVQYTTQGGSLKACSVTFFEANSTPWNPAAGVR